MSPCFLKNNNTADRLFFHNKERNSIAKLIRQFWSYNCLNIKWLAIMRFVLQNMALYKPVFTLIYRIKGTVLPFVHSSSFCLHNAWKGAGYRLSSSLSVFHLTCTVFKGTVSWVFWPTVFPLFYPIQYADPLFTCWSIFAFGFEFTEIFTCSRTPLNRTPYMVSLTLVSQA